VVYKFWTMKQFGRFLSNLRSNANISLEDMAVLVESSKSTLSRLENDEIPQPFKGPIRKTIIALAELLCFSHRETERYLELAGIDLTLLTESEKLQLGFMRRVVQSPKSEKDDLEKWREIYKQRLDYLESREAAFGISRAPPNLKLRIQEYTNILKEIHERLDKLYNRVDTVRPLALYAVPIHYDAMPGGRIVVGYHYGEEHKTVPTASNLYALASQNARYLMQLADAEYFAVDDCILLTNSKDFQGWTVQDIKTTIITTPLPIPDDLEKLQQEKIPIIEKHYFNAPHYRLVSVSPAFSDLDHLKVTLAPLGFYDYYSLNPFFDEPLLTALDGGRVSIREKYGNTALTYSSTDRGTSLIPAPVSIQCVLVTKDREIVLMQRSSSVAFYPNHWSASFEETMNAPTSGQGDLTQMGDTSFFATALRGLNEEFAISADAVENIKILSLNVEYLTLSADIVVVIHVALSADEIKQSWLLKAWHRNEASRCHAISADLEIVRDKFFSRTLWHPTSRMRLLQFLFYTYGVDEVVRAFNE